MTTDLQNYAGEDFCYLTTTGRVTGRPHTIEIWFAIDQRTLYMLSEKATNADWVKNLMRKPEVTVRIKDTVFSGQGRVVEDADEDARARRVIVDKYQPTYSQDLTEWGRSGLMVAVDLVGVKG